MKDKNGQRLRRFLCNHVKQAGMCRRVVRAQGRARSADTKAARTWASIRVADTAQNTPSAASSAISRFVIPSSSP